MAEVDQDLPHVSAGRIVTGAADPALSRKDHGRNFGTYRVGDVAAAIVAATAGAAAAADGIPRTAPVVVSIAGIINSAVETESAVSVAVKDKEITGATNAAVESEVPAMSAATMKAVALKALAMKALAMKALAMEAADTKAAAMNPPP
jgi:hypothetical protein